MKNETNSLRPPLTFGHSAPRTPKLLIAIVILAALVLAFVIGTYVVEIPPAHLLMIGLVVFWMIWRARKQWRKN